MILQPHAQLPQIVRTRGTLRRAARRLHRRQEQRHQDPDHGNHDQQLDKRERFAFALAQCRQLDEREPRRPMGMHPIGYFALSSATTRQILPPESSATSSDPSAATATPTGRP